MTVSGVLADVGTALTSALSVVTDNPVLAVFLGFAIIGGAMSAFSALKGGVR